MKAKRAQKRCAHKLKQAPLEQLRLFDHGVDYLCPRCGARVEGGATTKRMKGLR
jgi:hypothetical protein